MAGGYVVACQPIEGAASVAPCSDVGGVHFAPVMQAVGWGAVDASNSGQLVANVIVIVLSCFVVGLVVGSIMKVIRSA